MTHQFLFTGENCTNGLTYIYGKSLANGRVYRWEPLATRLRGEEAAAFRRKAEARHRSLTAYCQTVGILKVEGPVTYQTTTLIGWEAVSGEPLFTQFPLTLSLEERIKQLKPLIHSYRQLHDLNTVVGLPDWKRIYLGEKGLFTPDPLLLNFLSTPLTNLPPGLMGCHPPESFSGQPLTQHGDLFFLGLLIYLFCTGHLPYPLVNTWPTRALVNGEVIPPTVFSPELPPELAGLMVQLLSAAPERRPSAVAVEEYWEKFVAEVALTPLTSIAVRDASYHRLKQNKEYQKWRRQKFAKACLLRWFRPVRNDAKALNNFGRKRRKGWAVTAVFFGFILILGTLCWSPGKRMESTVRDMVEEQLAQMSALAFPGYPLPPQLELWADLVAAKEERLAAAARLLAQPVIEVEAVRELNIKPNWAQLEVSLIWRRWVDNHWQTSRTEEVLVVERKGQGWKITDRYPQEEKVFVYPCYH